MNKVEAFAHRIDIINDWSGKIASSVVVPVVFLVAAEVILRYIFNRPTIWVWDVNIQLMALIGALGAGFNLLHGGHVRMDVITSRLSERARAIVDLVTFPLFALVVIVLLRGLSMDAMRALVDKETLGTYWDPPLYPIKIVIAAAVLLLLLQLIAKLIHDISFVIRTRGAGSL